MTLNEWGDFIAGVSAPLAFLWLVVAVFIQSNELSEQRAELRLTRREFELNRDVMKAQAEDAQKQAEYIGKQTEIMTKEAEDSVRREKARAVDSTIAELSSVIRQHLFDERVVSGIGHMDREGFATFRGLATDTEGWILSFTAFLHSLADTGLKPPYFVNPAQSANMLRVYTLAASALADAEEIGDHSKHRVERIRIPDLVRFFETVFSANQPTADDDRLASSSTMRFRLPGPAG